MSCMCIPATAVLTSVLILASAVYTEPVSNAAQRRIERKCSDYDDALIEVARQRMVNGLSSGKRRVEVWKAVRSWIESREDIPSKFLYCAKAILDVEYKPYEESAERRRQQKVREAYSEWYALSSEKQAQILYWRKLRAAMKGPDKPLLQFTKWTKRDNWLDWSVRTLKIGDVGVLKEPARVRKIIDANSMAVSIGSHRTKIDGGWANGIRIDWLKHSFGEYDRRITTIIVEGVRTNGLVANTDLDSDLWGLLRVTRTTADYYSQTMYVVEPVSDKPSAFESIPVPPSVLKEQEH